MRKFLAIVITFIALDVGSASPKRRRKVAPPSSPKTCRGRREVLKPPSISRRIFMKGNHYGKQKIPYTGVLR